MTNFGGSAGGFVHHGSGSNDSTVRSAELSPQCACAPAPTSDVQLVQVIRTRLERRGDGLVPGEPVRIIEQYWSLDGELLAESDPWLRMGGEVNRMTYKQEANS